MATTTAQRQAKYRASRGQAGDNGERRLNSWISTKTALALERLARKNKLTKRQQLEQLIVAADDAVLKTMDPESSEWDEYFCSLRSNDQSRENE